MGDTLFSIICDRGEEIGAYLDGEVSAADQEYFEQHLNECNACATELHLQRGLLRTLDFAFAPEQSLELPDGFSHLIALRAESDVSGIRSWTGSGRALRLSAALALGVALLLLIGSSEQGPLRLRELLFGLLGILDLVSRFVYDLVLGLAVIIRAIGRFFVGSPSPFGALSVLLFFGTALILVRQLRRFHRG